MEGVESGKQFVDALMRKGIQSVGKGEAWGVALMKYALQHPELPAHHAEAGTTRPVIEVARLLVSARNAGYLRSLEALSLDPDTGKFREKSI